MNAKDCPHSAMRAQHAIADLSQDGRGVGNRLSPIRAPERRVYRWNKGEMLLTSGKEICW
jgi:hypothetical protein